MGVRGRKTAGDVAVKKRELETMGLPPAPSWFPEDETREWTDIVVAYPADRFPRATWPMLENYVRHTVNARDIGKRLDMFRRRDADDQDYREYDRLLGMLSRESKLVASFGVRLGIARTSMAGRHNNDPDETADTGAPWDD